MGRLFSSWIGRAVLASALVALLLTATATAAEPGALAALLLSMVVVAGAVALRKQGPA